MNVPLCNQAHHDGIEPYVKRGEIPYDGLVVRRFSQPKEAKWRYIVQQYQSISIGRLKFLRISMVPGEGETK